MNYINARVLKPQRLVDIDKQEERRRLEQTWKLMDERIWICAFGSPTELAKHVVNPHEFAANRKRVDIIQSDQTPVYAMLRPDKQLFADWEVSRKDKGEKSSLSAAQKQGG